MQGDVFGHDGGVGEHAAQDVDGAALGRRHETVDVHDLLAGHQAGILLGGEGIIHFLTLFVAKLRLFSLLLQE